jgi:DNA-binding transcriptional MerR regulator
MMPRLLTLTEVAELTRLPISTLRYYRQRGSGPPTFRVGRRVMAYETDVLAWVDHQRDTEVDSTVQSIAQRRRRS